MEENSALGYLPTPIGEPVVPVKAPANEAEFRRGLCMWKAYLEASLCGDAEFEGQIYTADQFWKKHGNETIEFMRYMELLSEEIAAKG